MPSHFSVIVDDGQSVMHKICSSFNMESCHAHTHNELLFLVQNDLLVENNTDIIEVHAPAVILHNSFTLHRVKPVHAGNYERYIINFDDKTLAQDPALTEDISFFKRTNMTVIRLTEEMRDLLLFYLSRYSALHDNAAAKNHLTVMILYELSQYHSDENTLSLEPKRAYINEIMNYIMRNPGETITLESLANRHFVSRAKLVADFRSSTGMTVKNYITLVRMNIARNLLIEGHSVSETAGLCGYNSESNFITTFKRMYDVSPGNYLAHLQKKLENAPPEYDKYDYL